MRILLLHDHNHIDRILNNYKILLILINVHVYFVLLVRLHKVDGIFHQDGLKIQ